MKEKGEDRDTVSCMKDRSGIAVSVFIWERVMSSHDPWRNC